MQKSSDSTNVKSKNSTSSSKPSKSAVPSKGSQGKTTAPKSPSVAQPSTKAAKPTPAHPSDDMKLPPHEQQKFIETLSEQERKVIDGVDLNEFINYSTELPKRPLTGFFSFSETIRDEVRAKHPELKVTQLGSIFSQRWKALTDAQREEYNKASQEAQEKYKIRAAKIKHLAELQERCRKFYKETLGIVDFPIVDGISWQTSLAHTNTKRLMALDPDMSHISKDAVTLTARATEAFIVHLGKSVAEYLRRTNKKRKTLSLPVLSQVVFSKPEFAFLRSLPILAELKNNKNLLKDTMDDDDDDEEHSSDADVEDDDDETKSKSEKIVEKLQMNNDNLQSFLQSQKQLARFVLKKDGSDASKAKARDIYDDLTPDDGVVVQPKKTTKKAAAVADSDSQQQKTKQTKKGDDKQGKDDKKKTAPADTKSNALTKAIKKPESQEKTSKIKVTKPSAVVANHDDDDDDSLFDEPVTKSPPKEKKRKRDDKAAATTAPTKQKTVNTSSTDSSAKPVKKQRKQQNTQ